MPSMDIATAHYLKPAVMTTPGSYQPLFTDLPRGIAGLAEVGHGLLIHEHIAGAYEVTLTGERRASVHVRPVAGLLGRTSLKSLKFTLRKSREGGLSVLGMERSMDVVIGR